MSEAPSPSRALMRPAATVLENQEVARGTFRLRIADPEIARRILPGQFVMVRAAAEGTDDPLLGRPFALYDVQHDSSGKPTSFEVVYLVIGRGTDSLSRRRPGDRVDVWGPLGNGFGPSPGPGSALFVAGGIGQTPFLALGRDWLGKATYGDPSDSGRATTVSSATLLYGVRSAGLLAGVEDFERAGIGVEIATDDGSAGRHGFVTQLLADRFEAGDRPAKVVACGPPPMLAGVARLTQAHGVACDVSLENHMACGFGACFSCVTPILQDDGRPDLRRVCVEGPVFPADRVDWSRPSH
ncbi:dihydroorotate dehydrogenase electron transfer subunit [Paludisphaera mucosa]|uniref:Dihydroorotate dehydrogenase electron transfer subunit n=1 Tax=Paludisphaera mucosa TaxID=3030827 RepID=A0ABT6FES8_9BACT|nr:dihydroorotate dehydrogenase electron transfer subunit [Paludisphaera mucosa]MDG3006076.1 dihydroorotate dehydrogenase electron transfer subunit [Paludisphaera mucosa]